MNKVMMIDLIRKFCDFYGYFYRDDYSGRFMFGACCVGIVYNNLRDIVIYQLTEFLRNTGVLQNYITQLISNVCYDSMSLSYIMYSPILEVCY